MNIDMLHLIDPDRLQALTMVALHVILILALALVATLVIKKLLRKMKIHLLEKSGFADGLTDEESKRAETLTRLIRKAVLIGLWIIVALIILKELGVEIAPILAGAGILGLAVGFGAQNLVRDVISGFFFILEDQVRVGDVAVVNGTGGLVEQINFRTIVLRDLEGVVHVFPNGTVSTLSNRTKTWSGYVFDLGVAYKEDTDTVIKIIAQVGEEMMRDPTFGPLMLDAPEIFGVDRFDDSAVVIKGRLKTKPIQQWVVGREFLRRIKYAFDEAGIEIPFPHQTVYFGDASKPFELKILEAARDRP
ncbi:MAG TPA: mechanosensitive ion channel family protein [Deltaproteobacteria bacterium]|nr:mechanosensitive ion channel family protein [Deltaproteobacteria bacterium]HRW79322.1 mechanosensitive ion channel family protein [Desulfomonilia bacterium]NMD39178.1 mechanosensitive ion channel family protein [Deltaproteobacteria bacterium]HNQ84824.1 mechanosensitive ion channel family protein [Deltaproteobacteria bacterium]HNS89629.1 mechanosensitive ion channel family protein [Deltaproteobacteria bacterium]